MRALVVGGGSIGTRHLKNLKTLRVSALAVVEPDEARLGALIDSEGIKGFSSLETALQWSPDLVIIASPSNLHVPQALMTAMKGIHFFVEKPLSHTPEGLEDLVREVQNRDLITMVGCNMRFHPGPSQIRRMIQQGKVGKILFARIHAGSYLPSWRPAQDYRQTYSARSSMGGGCILDAIHEIDLARWYLGEVKEVSCWAERLSSLEIDAEDVACLVCKHESGEMSEIHLDYVQRTYERGCQIVGEQGTLFWDFREGTVRWFDGSTEEWFCHTQPQDLNLNEMYVDELRHFLECVRQRSQTTLPVPEAVRVMEIAFAAKESVHSRRVVQLRRMCS